MPSSLELVRRANRAGISEGIPALHPFQHIPPNPPLDLKAFTAKDNCMPNHKDWKYIKRFDIDDGRVSRYTISFYRKRNLWYDEIRYDSHETKRGLKLSEPHFHLKLRSSFKGDADKAVEEIREIIDNYLRMLEEVVER